MKNKEDEEKNGKINRTKSISMKKKNMMRLGGVGLSLEAFANAKSTRNNYNPALISTLFISSTLSYFFSFCLNFRPSSFSNLGFFFYGFAPFFFLEVSGAFAGEWKCYIELEI